MHTYLQIYYDERSKQIVFIGYVIGICVANNNVFHDNAVLTPYSNIKPS